MKRLLTLALAAVCLSAFTGCSKDVIYDNGMVTIDFWDGCYITEDYSYNTTTMLLFTGMEGEEPQGICSLQVDTDSEDLELQSAKELFDSEAEEFNSDNFTEISSENLEGAEWTLTSLDIPMSEMYYIYTPDSNTTLIFRALLNTEYCEKHHDDLLNFVDRVDVYGSRVLLAGEQIHEYYESQAASSESAAAESSSVAED